LFIFAGEWKVVSTATGLGISAERYGWDAYQCSVWECGQQTGTRSQGGLFSKKNGVHGRLWL